MSYSPWIDMETGVRRPADPFSTETAPTLDQLGNAYLSTAAALVRKIGNRTARIMMEYGELVVGNNGDKEQYLSTRPFTKFVPKRIKRIYDNTEEVVEHDFIERLKSPNSQMTTYQLWSYTQCDLDIFGRAFWYVPKHDDKIWLLRPQRMRVLRNDNGEVVGYKNGHKEDDDIYKADEVIFFRVYSPKDPYANQDIRSPIESVWLELRLLQKELSSWDALTTNLARPDFLLSPKNEEMVSPDAAEKLQKQIEQRFNGGERGGPLVPTYPVDLQILNWQPKDLSGLQLDEALSKKLCHALDVPYVFLNMEEASWAASDVSELCIQRYCIEPRAANLAETITKWIQQKHGKRLFFIVTEFEQEDKDYRLREQVADQQAVNNGVMMISEYRSKWGLPPRPGTEVFKQPSPAPGMFGSLFGGDTSPEVAEGIAGAKPDSPQIAQDAPESPPADAKDKRDPKAVLAIQTAFTAGEIAPEAARANLVLVQGYTEEEANALIVVKPVESQQQSAQPAQKTRTKSKPALQVFIEALRRAFRRQAKQALSTLGKGKSIRTKSLPEPSRWFDYQDELDAMTNDLTPIVQLFWKDSAQAIIHRYGFDADVAKVVNEQLPAAVQKAVLAFCQATLDTTNHELDTALSLTRQNLAEGMEQGEAANKLSERVKSVFEDLDTARSYRIAVTEQARAQNEAELLSIKSSGVEAKKVWLTRDQQSCDLCVALNGESRGLDEPFADDGKGTVYSEVQSPPAHPHCTCAMTFETDGNK